MLEGWETLGSNRSSKTQQSFIENSSCVMLKKFPLAGGLFVFVAADVTGRTQEKRRVVRSPCQR